MKKKLYNSPEAKILEIQLPNILEISVGGVTGDEDERGDDNDSGMGTSNEYVGGSWENIWNE